MSTTEIIQIAITTLGGIALLLYGMNVLGSGLEKISGGKMEKILEKLTNNIFKAVILGFGNGSNSKFKRYDCNCSRTG